MIRNPQFPPKAGFVEVEINGVRQYKKVETEQENQLESVMQENAALREQMAAMDGAFTDFLINVVPLLGPIE